MERSGSSGDELFQKLTLLRKHWIKGGWSWDNRLDCVASSFSVELAEEALRAALVALPQEWNTKNLASAPALIREVAESTGGVRTDQRILSTNTPGRVIAYGLWWPWGDDTTISLRVGLTGYVSEPDTVRFRMLFDVVD
jgi:hypothetical protein